MGEVGLRCKVLNLSPNSPDPYTTDSTCLRRQQQWCAEHSPQADPRLVSRQNLLEHHWELHHAGEAWPVLKSSSRLQPTSRWVWSSCRSMSQIMSRIWPNLQQLWAVWMVSDRRVDMILCLLSTEQHYCTNVSVQYVRSVMMKLRSNRHGSCTYSMSWQASIFKVLNTYHAVFTSWLWCSDCTKWSIDRII